MSIGSVLALLREDFPDVTISKIRFLESEGLISPERAPSGYRRFSQADCDRLRFVLTAQRDRYLPLKVIKEQLDSIDHGNDGSTGNGTRLLSSARSAVAPATDFGSRADRVSRESLIERTGVDSAFVTELQRSGLLTPGPAGFFDEDAVRLVEAAAALASYGVETRHLRAFKVSADREAGLVAQIASPIAKGKGTGARDRAEELVREIAALSVTLHTQLVKAAVRDVLD
ncbi:putative MerR family transcriptional regulator [Gordonia polyisoprenivorans NBRC 16320 = JCM 10675]|uniref:MerR family DNA-binding transcriptional regulator n=1 Tax=Gordonia polyisoprenivorans TaxID=84595 RepID=A0A846WRF2_9ACTN|nr:MULTISPECIES: MerR family transcriptional regulator [Gordonia]MBE7193234.1 MerR family DNA-binding transcriptional regulator [Gordonia polyisoprenivorans]MDF3283324.1 MerR family DNA-binding transcriptional regulator [Gordonia sp. N1V]NKY04125.1 MerR family DNA-binding transcriptional regulator [Gordonia polyisoprenivorans]OZC30723.1 MerR family transcriptional regulator [Gordonia polyisoprenivorans]UZF53969.1 MerR family DNA-binding transcriptional regulator [Gordonia polyisoprenivorans]